MSWKTIWTNGTKQYKPEADSKETDDTGMIKLGHHVSLFQKFCHSYWRMIISFTCHSNKTAFLVYQFISIADPSTFQNFHRNHLGFAVAWNVLSNSLEHLMQETALRDQLTPKPWSHHASPNAPWPSSSCNSISSWLIANAISSATIDVDSSEWRSSITNLTSL